MTINSRVKMQLSLNDPNINAKILNEIATDLEVSVKILIDVVIHSNADENVLMSIVNNPNATSIVLVNILQHPKASKEILIAMLKNQNFDSMALKQLMSIYSDEYIREILAISLNQNIFEDMSVIWINLLSEYFNNDLVIEKIVLNKLKEIAESSNANSYILMDILSNRYVNEEILIILAENHNATAMVLVNILQHPKISKEVLITIFKNQNFDSIVLENMMSIYSDEYIKEILAILLNQDGFEDIFLLLDLLNLLSIRMNKTVMEEIIINKLKEIAESYNVDDSVLMDVLSNRYVNEEILIIIARNPNANLMVFAELLENILSTVKILKEILKNPNLDKYSFDQIFYDCIDYAKIAEIDLMVKHEYADQELFLYVIEKIPYSRLTKNILKAILNDNTCSYILNEMAAGCALNELIIILNHKNINLEVYNKILTNPNANPAILIRCWEKSNNLLNYKQKLQEILDYSDNINLEIINYILAFHRTRKANIEGSDAIFKLSADLISYILKFLFLEETGFVLPVKKSNFKTNKQYNCITFSNYEEKIEKSINKTIGFKPQQNKRKHILRIDR